MLGELLVEFGFLFGKVLAPILLLVALGALLQKRHPIEMQSLSNLQLYLFIPAFLFVHIADSTLTLGQIAGIAGAILLIQALLALPLYGFLVWRRVPREKLAVVLLASVIFNAGNFGIPVALRAFGKPGGEVQALVIMTANLSLWVIGYGLSAAITGSGWKQGVVEILKLPILYIMTAGLMLRATGLHLPEPIDYALHLVSDGLVPLALVTLGVQLATQWRMPRWRLILPVAFFKLLCLPAVAGLVVWKLGLWPWPGAQLIVASAGPTAVNSIFLAIEQKGDVELAAECVFWNTLLAAITVTIILAVVIRLGGVPST
ncbi:AEC family transporter [Armatimonas sp.]|uniref:AEC family transporter n=1 Tax=Armatimonas sp. TaxID=1872638 RepID=UPI0037538D39